MFGTAQCEADYFITTVPFSGASNLRSITQVFFRVVAKLVTEGEPLMRNSGADWLSYTIRSVEQIMERHGFQQDEPKIDAPATPITNEQLSPWDKLLRAARPLLGFRVI